MRPAALIDLSAELVAEVLRFQAPADAAVAAFGRQHRALGSRERHLLGDTVFELLRRRRWYEHLAGRADGGPQPKARRLALLAWQGDPALLDAALDEGERAWLATARAKPLPEDPSSPLRHNLPDDLAQALREQLGDATAFQALAAALLEPAPLDLRVNPMKGKRPQAIAALAAAGIEAEPTAHAPWGLRVRGKPSLARCAPFTDGLVEVQDEGSQLLAHLVDAHRGEIVVDFCAGAGGKTLAMGAAMRGTGRLYAMDVSGHRLEALKPRLARAGLGNVYPMQIAHERDDRLQRLAGKADRVLVDAPCSGRGTLRRSPDLKWRHGLADAEAHQGPQQAILLAAAELVKPGGRLVYATCSLLHAENEAVAAAFDDGHGRRFRRVDAADALAAARVERPEALVDGPNLRLWPHRHPTDGFFAAVWQRRG